MNTICEFTGILYTNTRENGWATIDARMASSKYILRTVQVETVTLEQLFQKCQISHCRLLKITAPEAIHESLNGFTRRELRRGARNDFRHYRP